MDFLQGFGGGGSGGGKLATSQATAQTIFGAKDTKELAAALPWLIGGLALVAIAFAAVLIAAVRR